MIYKQIYEIYNGSKNYKGNNIQTIILNNKIKNEDFDYNYFFPIIGQENPKFTKKDKNEFNNNEMIKIFYYEMIKRVLLINGYEIDDNLFLKYHNKYKNIIIKQ